MQASIQRNIDIWLNGDYDQATKKEIKQLIDANSEKELIDRFYTSLEFGTGGIRGVMEAGLNRVNIYTIRRATYGLALYLNKNMKDVSSKGVVIAHDSRNNSPLFALEAAKVLAAQQIPVFLFENLQTTPLLSFTVRHLKAGAGIVITASHNPKEYNGYKVYYDDGAQIVPPHDKGIIAEVNAVPIDKVIPFMEEDEAKSKDLIRFLNNDIHQDYLQALSKWQGHPENNQNKGKELKIVYTPLHGTGISLVPKALTHWGFTSIVIEPKQEHPDGNFSYAPSPNPEEKAALELGLELAKRENADILLANDPDSDRLGTAVKGTDGNYVLLNGNQVGLILSSYLCGMWKERGTLPKNGIIFSTIVSTDLIDDIALHYGVAIEKVLTGFKWIAAKVGYYYNLPKEQQKQFIFGFEESYGYCLGDFVRDKDGVSAACLFSEASLYYKLKGKTILDALDELYIQFGYSHETLESHTYKGKEGKEKIDAIMNSLRSPVPDSLVSSKVVYWADYQSRKYQDLNRNINGDVDLPKSNVLVFYLESGIRICVRPSGTEPKIKFYYAIRKPVQGKENLSQVKSAAIKELDEFQRAFNDWLKG